MSGNITSEASSAKWRWPRIFKSGIIETVRNNINLARENSSGGTSRFTISHVKKKKKKRTSSNFNIPAFNSRPGNFHLQDFSTSEAISSKRVRSRCSNWIAGKFARRKLNLQVLLSLGSSRVTRHYPPTYSQWIEEIFRDPESEKVERLLRFFARLEIIYRFLTPLFFFFSFYFFLILSRKKSFETFPDDGERTSRVEEFFQSFPPPPTWNLRGCSFDRTLWIETTLSNECCSRVYLRPYTRQVITDICNIDRAEFITVQDIKLVIA